MAIVTSLTLPIRALFITQELNGSLFENGVAFALPAMIGLIITPIIGDRSDTISDRRKIITFGLIWIGIGTALTAFVGASWLVIVITALTYPLFSSVNAQYFAWAGERPCKNGQGTIDSGQLRIGYVAGWVLGPAVCGGLLVIGFSFRGLFVLQAVGMVALAALIWAFRANPPKETKSTTEKFRWSRLNEVPSDLRNIALFVAFVMAGDMLRLANMSLFVAENISTAPSDLTIVYMATPVVELPAAVFFVWLAKRVGSKTVLATGVAAGLIYFAFSPFADNLWQMICLQAIYGLIPASVLTIGISYAQRCLPDRMGFATSVLFAGQSLAILLGGVLATISGAFLSVNNAYFSPLIFMVLAGLVWLRLPKR